MRYFARLSAGKVILWCYLLWYLFFAMRYFDPSGNLWLTSTGISGIVGIGLVLSTAPPEGACKLGRWQIVRLFLMPFCVSSFSALVKGKGFFLILSPRLAENYAAAGLCAAFCAFVAGIKLAQRKAS